MSSEDIEKYCIKYVNDKGEEKIIKTSKYYYHTNPNYRQKVIENTKKMDRKQ